MPKNSFIENNATESLPTLDGLIHNVFSINCGLFLQSCGKVIQVHIFSGLLSQALLDFMCPTAAGNEMECVGGNIATEQICYALHHWHFWGGGFGFKDTGHDVGYTAKQYL